MWTTPNSALANNEALSARLTHWFLLPVPSALLTSGRTKSTFSALTRSEEMQILGVVLDVTAPAVGVHVPHLPWHLTSTSRELFQLLFLFSSSCD
jgi:hypothetical protein